MNKGLKRRLERLENRQTGKIEMVVAWYGPIEPKPGQVVIGNGYWLHREPKENGEGSRKKEQSNETKEGS